MVLRNSTMLVLHLVVLTIGFVVIVESAPPKWNFLIQSKLNKEREERQEMERQPEPDYLRVPPPFKNIPKAQAKKSIHDHDAVNRPHSHRDREQDRPSQVSQGAKKYGGMLKTGRNAIVNYISAIRRMFSADKGSSRGSLAERGDLSTPFRGERAPTRYGTRQEYDEDNRVKAVVVKGADHTQSYLPPEGSDSDSLIGDLVSEFFWNNVYGAGAGAR